MPLHIASSDWWSSGALGELRRSSSSHKQGADLSVQEYVPSEGSRHPLWLIAGFWFSVVIAIAAVGRRLVELIRPSHTGPPHVALLDAAFSSHALLTEMHIIPAAILVLLSAAVLLSGRGDEWLERL